MKAHPLLAPFAIVALGACAVPPIDSPDTRPDTTGTSPDVQDTQDTSAVEPPDTVAPATPGWHTALSGLPSALLSVTGSAPDDLWLTGADKRDGTGPWVVHGTATGLRRLDLRPVDPAGGHLWWAALPDATWVYLVGEGGRVFRYHRATDLIEPVPTGTDATLYGVWGASASELWAVGGYVYPRTGPPTVVRVVDHVAEVVTDLPAGLADDTTLFKVWGTAADDVWVVGERGTVLRWDGAAWSLELLDGAPRLVTLHGAGPKDMVVVGGAAQAVIYERRDGGPWTDASPGPYPLLNGVFVAPSGAAVAVGLLGQTFRRDPAGAWTVAADLPLLKDWHAGWIDPRGDAWLVGGNLLSANAFDDGALLRWGPPRTDLPSGPVAGLDGPDVAEPAADVVEHEPDTAAPDASADDTAIADVGPEDADGGSTEDASDDASSPFGPELELGEVTPQGDFMPLIAGQPIEIVQGIQGGIHLEIGVRLTWPGEEQTLMVYLLLSLAVDGEEAARFLTLAYPTPRVAPNLFQTYAIPVIFTEVVAAPFVGKTATLSAFIRLPDETERRAEVPLTLVDEH